MSNKIPLSIISIFGFLFILGSTYQNFPLINAIGEIGRTPVILMLPIFLLSEFLITSSNNWKLSISSNQRYLLVYIGYLVLITFSYDFYLMQNGDFIILEENLIMKSLKHFTYPFLALLFYRFCCVFFDFFSDHIKILARILLLVNLFLLLILIIESYQLRVLNITPLLFLHSSSEAYYRIRLLTLESSYSGSVAIIIPAITVYLNSLLKKRDQLKLAKVIPLLFFVFYCISTNSKGFIIILALLLLLASKYLVSGRYKILLYIPAISAMIFISYIMLLNLYSNVLIALETSTTFATRGITAISAIKVFIHNPFGVGYGGYLKFFPQEIDAAMNTYFSGFLKHEVENYLHSARALSAKSEVLNNLMIGGIGFIVFFYNFFLRRLVKIRSALKINKDKSLALFIYLPLLFIVLSISTYLELTSKYDIWLFLAFVEVFVFKNRFEAVSKVMS